MIFDKLQFGWRKFDPKLFFPEKFMFWPQKLSFSSELVILNLLNFKLPMKISNFDNDQILTEMYDVFLGAFD